jgi:hypothetical protein
MSQEDGLEESQSVHTKRQLPDQKVKVHGILEERILENTVPDWTKNPLYRYGSETPDKLSSLHIPANNMFVSTRIHLQF